MAARLRASWRDHDNKTGTLACESYEPLQAEWAAFQTTITTFMNAIIAAIVGDVSPFKNWWSWDYDAPAKTNAASPLAQREVKWLCRYQSSTDSTAPVYRCEIPTADLSLLANNTEFLDLSAGAGATFKSAFEAIVVTPDAAEDAVTLLSVQFVSRR